ncbi:MAG TPA: histidine kinase [Spirochaetia bacterium]
MITFNLRTKILALSLSCTLVALVLQTVIFQYAASAIVYQQEKEASERSLQNMQEELYAWIKTYENNLIKVYNETDLIRDMSAPLPVEALRRTYNRVAYDLALAAFDPAQNVNALYVYTIDGELVSSYRSANTPRYNYPEDIFQNPSANNVAAVTSYVKSDERPMLVSSFFNTSRSKDVVRFVIKIYTNNVSKKIGFIVCDVDSNSFTRIVEKYVHSDRQLVWLQPAGDRPAFSAGARQGAQGALYARIASRTAGESRDQNDARQIDGTVFFRVPQQKYNLTAYSLTPRAMLEENQRVLRRDTAIIALVAIAVAVVLATLMTRSLTTPLARMSASLRRIKNGETDLRLDGLKTDEIGALGHTVNDMLDRIQTLIAEEYKVTLLLKQAEYRALQAQVNPHFLYNTLDTMSGVALAQNCDTVSRLCQALSNVFRYSIDMQEPLATIRAEIGHLKNYMYVMNVRTSNSVEVDIRVAEELLDEQVPRLSLQPLVENSFTHGLRNKRGPKRIVVSGTIESGQVILTVSDNGVGMDADEVNRSLRGNPGGTLDRSSSVGLGNIHARARLLFGDDYGVSVSSEEGRGSIVTLIVPQSSGGSDNG